MRIVEGIDQLGTPLASSVLTIGNFDGVHLAHQALLARARELARESAIPVVVLTFAPHPLAVLAPERVPPLLTPQPEKMRLLKEHGADVVVIARSEPSLLSMEPEEFVQRVVGPYFHPHHIVEGPSFRFGRGRRGTPELLERLSGDSGFTLHVVASLSVDLLDARREAVSSSLTRELLRAGRVEDAIRCLGRPYRLWGTVEAGDRRGRAIGFPTANLAIGAQLVPGDGVYAGMAAAGGAEWKCAISVGGAPTFGSSHRRVEAHLLDFDGDLYGREIGLDFVTRLRDQAAFAGAEALVRQLRQDVEQARGVSVP